jgi:hypothetical protein
MGPLLRTLQEAGYSIEDLEIDDDAEGGASLRRVRLEVFGDDDEDVEKTVRGAIGERQEIERISVEEL